jgi:hypothetical protein
MAIAMAIPAIVFKMWFGFICIGTVPPENEFCSMNWSEFSPKMQEKSLTFFGAIAVMPI